MPPSSPFGGRRRSSTLPSGSVSQKCTPWRIGRARFATLRGNVGGDAGTPTGAARQPWTQCAGGRSRRADRGAQIEQRLGEVRRPGLRRRITTEAAPRAAQPRSGLWQLLADCEQPRHHALDIAVHRHPRHTERDRADRSGGVVADPRQRAQSGRIAWERARRDHGAGAGVQVAGASIVAKARPGGEHILQRRDGERRDGGEAGYEPFIVRDRRRNGGLLQHDLAEPDMVRIGDLARCRAPGQRPPMAVIPGEQRRGGERHGRRYEQ